MHAVTLPPTTFSPATWQRSCWASQSFAGIQSASVNTITSPWAAFMPQLRAPAAQRGAPVSMKWTWGYRFKSPATSAPGGDVPLQGTHTSLAARDRPCLRRKTSQHGHPLGKKGKKRHGVGQRPPTRRQQPPGVVSIVFLHNRRCGEPVSVQCTRCSLRVLHFNPQLRITRRQQNKALKSRYLRGFPRFQQH